MALIYNGLLKTLYAKKRFTGYTDLAVIHTCLERLGHPDKAYPTVHIAGTNGKGHVATMIAAALEKSGYRVGLFTSPHLFHFEERIVVDGIPIAKEKVMSLYSLLQTLPFNLIFFELVTLMGLTHFRDEKVDVAVIETGMGGLFDATNVITPLVSVITSISLEHTERLGHTLEAIAAHKAGIIKPRTPVVLGVKAQEKVFFAKAEEKEASIYPVEGDEPFYQIENQKCAEQALKVLSAQFALPPKTIALGLQATPKCRFEQKGEWIFDVAHNPDGFYRLSQALNWHFPNSCFRFILGMGRNKQIKECLRWIEPHVSHIHFISDGRAESASTDELAKAFEDLSQRPYTKEASTHQAIANALEGRGNNKIVVCGSFHIMNLFS